MQQQFNDAHYSRLHLKLHSRSRHSHLLSVGRCPAREARGAPEAREARRLVLDDPVREEQRVCVREK